jgi:hypothetical protein
MLTGPVAWKAVIVLSLVSQAWLAWSVIVAVRAWPNALRLPIGDDAAIGGLRIACGVGTVALGGYALLRTFTGLSPMQHLYNAHVVEAFIFASPVFGLVLPGLVSAAWEVGLGIGAIARDIPEISDANEAKAKAAWEKAKANHDSLFRDVQAFRSEARAAHAEADLAEDTMERAFDEIEEAKASGDEAARNEATGTLSAAQAAHGRAVAFASVADAKAEASNKAFKSAQHDEWAARLAWQSAAEAAVKARAAAAASGGNSDKP